MAAQRAASWGVAPQPRAWGPPGPQDPRPETLSLDSEGVCEAARRLVVHASWVVTGDSMQMGMCQRPFIHTSIPYGVVWRGVAPASGGARGGQRPRSPNHRPAPAGKREGASGPAHMHILNAKSSILYVPFQTAHIPTILVAPYEHEPIRE